MKLQDGAWRLLRDPADLAPLEFSNGLPRLSPITQLHLREIRQWHEMGA